MNRRGHTNLALRNRTARFGPRTCERPFHVSCPRPQSSACRSPRQHRRHCACRYLRSAYVRGAGARISQWRGRRAGTSLPRQSIRATRGQPIELGQRAAAAILSLRADDGSAHAEPRVGIEFVTSTEPGKWRQDPVSRIPLALGAYWDEVTPFVMASSAQFRAPSPPALDSAEYAQAFAEVKALGGDGVVTPTGRTTEQTATGIFWAYDGTPSLCAPPRLYNQIATQIADQMGSDVVELTRLLALVN